MADGYTVIYNHSKAGIMKVISNTLFDKFFNLLIRLEPENIWMDGEASKAEARKRETAIRNQWRDLEYLVGRKVFHEEIWDMNIK